MKRIFSLAAVLVMAFSEASAEPTMKPFAYGIMLVPLRSGEEYSFRMVRVGVNVVQGWYLTRFEYDGVKSELKIANGEASGKWRGNTFTITTGRQLSSIGFLYPQPKLCRLTRNPDMQTGFLMVVTGVSGEWRRGSVKIRLTHFGSNSGMALARWGMLGLFWQKDAGCGAILKREGSVFFNPYAGVARYSEGGKIVAFVQNYVALRKSWRLYAHTDFGDTEEEVMLGTVFEYHANSFVKLFYDSAKEGKLVLELSFSAL